MITDRLSTLQCLINSLSLFINGLSTDGLQSVMMVDLKWSMRVGVPNKLAAESR